MRSLRALGHEWGLTGVQVRLWEDEEVQKKNFYFWLLLPTIFLFPVVFMLIQSLTCGNSKQAFWWQNVGILMQYNNDGRFY